MKALCRASNALEIFNQYDDDGSGELDGDEFRAMMALTQSFSGTST